MDNVNADFTINSNNPIEAEFSLGDSHLACTFELFAAGTTWGSISGELSNQTDLQDTLDAKQDAISDLSNIRSEASKGANAYEAIQSYGDIVSYNAANFATSIQGALADSALQPGDNVSELINDSGYITSASLPTIEQNYNSTSTNAQSGVAVAQAVGAEATNRENADNNLQSQIDAITASSDVTDIVGTYAQLQAYDTTELAPNSIIKVLQDESQNDETTYYRWVITGGVGSWVLIGEEGPYYTKSEADGRFVPQTRTINGKALSLDIALDAIDVGALPSSTIIPTVNNGTLDIQVNGASVGTFTANQSGDTTANIVVPDSATWGNITGTLSNQTDLQDVLNDKQNNLTAGTDLEITSSNVINFTGIIPTKTSELDNDDNFISNIATNANAITVAGTPATNSYSINFGKNSSVGSNNCIAFGYGAQAQGNYALGFGYYARAKASNAIQLGYGTNNTADSLQIGTYPLLDTSTGLIPDGRISSNIARTSDIPTAISELTNDSGYITGISGSDVITALGYTPYDDTNPDGYTSNVGTVTSVNNTLPDVNGNVTISTGGTVDQTYNASSTNAQSGVAINGANFIQNTATGTDSLTLLGVDNTTYDEAINIGNRSVINGDYAVAIGGYEATYGETQAGTQGTAIGISANAESNGVSVGYGAYSNTNGISIGSETLIEEHADNSIVIGYQAQVDGSSVYSNTGNNITNAIQLGTGVNETSDSLQVGNYQLIDTSTGLIPDARLSSNIARTSNIPTATSDLTNDSNFVQNVANGSGSISVLGTGTNGSNAVNIGNASKTSGYSVSIGYNSNASTGYSICLGSSATSTSNSGIAIGRGTSVSTSVNGVAIGRDAKTTADYAIQLGKGTNATASSLNIGFDNGGLNNNYQLLDGITGLIPDARLSTNIARSANIPTVTSDLINDSGYITGITGSDVTTALGYIPVNKAGDTMTGDLALKFSGLDLSTTVSTNTYYGVEIQDTNGYRVGRVEGFQKTDGSYGISIGTKVYGVNTYPKLDVWLDSSNVSHSSFPNTKCVDGQWIASSYVIASSVNINGSTELSYDISSFIPKDGYNYEILVMARCVGTTTNNQYCPLYIGTTLTSDHYVLLTASRQASTTANTFGGCSVIPIGTNRMFYVVRDTSYHGTIEQIKIQAYRRIGTNS